MAHNERARAPCNRIEYATLHAIFCRQCGVASVMIQHEARSVQAVHYVRTDIVRNLASVCMCALANATDGLIAEFNGNMRELCTQGVRLTHAHTHGYA